MRSPSVTAASPGGSNRSNRSSGQYSSGQFSYTIPSRDTRRHPSAAPMQGVVMSQSWSDKYSSGGSVENAAIDPYHHIFDTEMSSEGTNDAITAPLSNHPTPPTSHHASSHTSYSPRTDDGRLDPSSHSHPHGGRQVQPGQAPYYAAPSGQFHAGYGTTGETFPAQHSTSHGGAGPEYGMGNMAGDWGAMDATPAMGDQAWAALDAMGWSEPSTIGVPLEGWRVGGVGDGVNR